MTLADHTTHETLEAALNGWNAIYGEPIAGASNLRKAHMLDEHGIGWWMSDDRSTLIAREDTGSTDVSGMTAGQFKTWLGY